jgi:hypothetical protein
MCAKRRASHWLFCGDTLFGAAAAACSKARRRRWRLAGKLAALPDDTKVFCAHEYTLSNLRFARSAVEPGNAGAAAERVEQVEKATIPSCARAQPAHGAEYDTVMEKATNPFLRYREPAIRRNSWSRPASSIASGPPAIPSGDGLCRAALVEISDADVLARLADAAGLKIAGTRRHAREAGAEGDRGSPKASSACPYRLDFFVQLWARSGTPRTDAGNLFRVDIFSKISAGARIGRVVAVRRNLLSPWPVLPGSSRAPSRP